MMMIDGQQLPNYTDFDSLLELYKSYTARYKDNVLVHYQLNNSLEFKTLTYGQVDKITTHLANVWKPALPTDTQCIGFLSDSPVQSILAFITVLKLGLVYFPLSTCNSEEANTHLLNETKTSFLIASESCRKEALGCAAAAVGGPHGLHIGVKIWNDFNIDKLVATVTAVSTPPVEEDTDSDDIDCSRREKRRRVKRIDPNDTVSIMHSSGTTSAYPKPIQRNSVSYIYTAIEVMLKPIQSMGPGLAMDSTDVVISTAAMYRVPAISILLMTMLVGASILLFNREAVTPGEVLVAAEKYRATVLASPPILLEQLAEHFEQNSSDTTSTTAVLKRIKYCLCGGAPLRRSAGIFLRSRGLNVQVDYGMTETACLALSDVARDNEHWYSIKPTANVMQYITFERFDNDMHQLVVHSNCPSLANGAGNRSNGDYATKDLFIEDSPGSGTWHFARRTDDVLIMNNGEKTDPMPMENEIRNESIIQNCIVIGEGREYIAALVELNMDKALDYSPVTMTSKVYEAVRKANELAPHHGMIPVPNMVYILPLRKQLPKSSKGTIIRKKAIADYHQEIEQMYAEFTGSVTADFQ